MRICILVLSLLLVFSQVVRATEGVCESLLNRADIKVEYIGLPGATRIIYYFHGARQDFSWEKSDLRQHILDVVSEEEKGSIAFAAISFGPFWVFSDQETPILPEYMVHFQQFINFIEESEKERGFQIQERFALGHSMGSTNALTLELNRPGLFKRMAFTGPAFFSYDPTRISFSATIKIAKAFFAMENVSFGYKLKAFVREAFFSPVGYSLFTGRIKSLNTWPLLRDYFTAPSNWAKADQSQLLQQRAQDGQSLPEMFLVCGQKDVNFYPGVSRFCERMGQLGVDVRKSFPVEAGHNGPFNQKALARFLVTGNVGD